MKLRGKRFSSEFKIENTQNTSCGCAETFLNFLHNNEKTEEGKALNGKIKEAVIGYLKEKNKKDVRYGGSLKTDKRHAKMTEAALGFQRHLECDDILELSFETLRGFVPVAVYSIDLSEELSGNEELKEESFEIENFRAFPVTQGLISICKAQFGIKNTVLEDEYEENEEGRLLMLIEKLSHKLSNIKKPGICKKLKGLNFKPFALTDKEGKGFLLVPYKLNVSMFGRHVSDSRILKTVRQLSNDAHGLMGELYTKDIYNFSVLMTCLAMYDEIEDKTTFFSDKRFFADNEESTLLPTALHYMNNSYALKSVISKALCGNSEFSYDEKPREAAIKEFRNDLAGKKGNASDKKGLGNPFTEIYSELFKEKVRITVGDGHKATVIPFYDFLKNEDGYTIGSKEVIGEDDNHIFIPDHNVQRIHGIVFFDESVDSLVYRRTTTRGRTLYEGNPVADDFEIYDGALIYIGDVLVKFEYFIEKGN